MFTGLKNWFRDVRGTPPGPLRYMRLGTEGRDVNPLMVPFVSFDWELLTYFLTLVPILYVGLFTSNSKLVDTF